MTRYKVPSYFQPGTLYQLGRHRLLCGDATKAEDVAKLFGGEKFSVCFTSPMYTDQRTYKLQGKFNWTAYMIGAFQQMVAFGKPDCHILINLGQSHKEREVNDYWDEWILYAKSIGWPLFGRYIWHKGSPVPGDYGGRLTPSYEFIFHFTQGRSYPNRWIKTQGDHKGLRSARNPDGTMHGVQSPDKVGQPYKIPESVIQIRAAHTAGKLEADFPAVFPLQLPWFMYKTWSQPSDIVYEPFCGSGTSILAAENSNRICYALELEKTYCDLALTRFEGETGQKARLISG